MVQTAPLPAPGLPAPFDPLTLDTMSDEALDLLPFGVVCTDAVGRVLRYNRAESRLARLDRQHVLGRNFYREVVPSAGTPQFEGRVRQLLASPPAVRTLRFDAFFDFRFGAQQVRVEVVRSEAGRVWLLLRRTRFFPPRHEVPAAFKAPLQAELAPGEAAQGVLRDAVQRRTVQLTPAVFQAMRASWERVAPRGWPLFALEWGFRWGRLAVVDLEADALELSHQSLRELPMRVVVEHLAAALQEQGWGRLSVDLSGSQRGACVVRLERSALAEAVGPAREPQCHLLAGYLRAVFCHLAQKLLVVREVGCRSTGQPHCTFVVVGPARRAALETAVAHGAGDPARVLAALLPPH